jgi:NAD(P)-dependent dehydrogenase (short-subunit alcohol dehydrogenase family)
MKKIAFVTGATEGIGKATAIGLAKKGYKVIVHGRNATKTKNTVEEIKQLTGTNDVDYLLADLSSLTEVKALPEAYKAKYNRLDVLINNAAAMFAEKQVSKEGHEMMFAVNYLALVTLTHNLLDIIKTTPSSRIVNLSSVAYKTAKPNFDDVNCESSYNMMRDYSNSKLYVLYYSLDLADRLNGTGVTVNVVHPGGVKTQLARDFKGPLKWIFSIMMPLFFISVEKGAETSIFVATDESLNNTTGKYFVKNKPEPLKPIGTSEQNRKRLEEITRKLLSNFL